MASRGDIDLIRVQPEIFYEWLQLQLEDVLEKTGTFTKLKAKDCFDEGTFPVVDQGEKFISGYVNDEELIYQGEVPVVIFGDHTRVVKYVDFEFAAGADGTKILKPFKFLDSKFFFYYLKSLNVPSLGYSRHFSVIKSITVPLPPLAEQKRIVAKLDEAFRHLDTLKAKLERIPELLKNFRQAVLTQAVTGKLTEEWRDGKNLSILKLEDNFRMDFKLLEFTNLPASWNYSALGNYAQCSRGKFTARPRNDPQFFDGEYPFMQIGDLPKEGGLTVKFSKTLNEKGKTVSKDFPAGTVVIAIVGATIGNTGILGKEMYFPDSLVGINSASLESNYYINYFLRVIKLKLRELSYAGGGQPNIKLTNILNLAIPIPPLEELKEILKRVEALFVKADAIEGYYATLKEKIDKLPQALLTKAFRGELVPQDPNDEPASVLLEKIKADKAGTAKPAKGKKAKGGKQAALAL